MTDHLYDRIVEEKHSEDDEQSPSKHENQGLDPDVTLPWWTV